jgi:hypothetical protein
MENIVFYSSKVLLSENESNPDSYIAKFIICDFGFNANGVGLNRDTIETWMDTLKNKPLVGKIKLRSDGELDFSGHNMTVVTKTDDDGNEYQDVEFLTDAFGTFTDVSIETIDGIEYIVATAEIWKRFNRACEIIKRRVEEGTLHTSWEISVVDSIKKLVSGTTKKVVNTGRFIGHCLLSKDTTPAYQSSGLLEIASSNEDTEISEALSKDFIESFNIKNSSEKEDVDLKKDKVTEVSEEVVNTEENLEVPVETTDSAEITTETDEITVEESISEEAEITTDPVEENTDSVETSALTDRDLRMKLMESCEKKLDTYGWIAFHFPMDKTVWFEDYRRESELDYVLFTYEVTENDEITLSEPQNVSLTVNVSELNSTIDTKNDAIVKASEEIQTLKTQISELSPYKEKFEKVEQEKIANEIAEKKQELISKYEKSGLITKEEFETSEEIKAFVDTFNETALKEIVATRYMASKEKEVVEVSEEKETSQVIPSASLVDDGVTEDKVAVMKQFLRK